MRPDGVECTPDSERARHPQYRREYAGSERPSRRETGRGMTPVVSHVLLVAIVIILAVTVSVFALGLAEQFEQAPPTAAFEAEYADDNGLILQHRGGDVLDVAELSVQFGDRSYPVTDYISSQRLDAGTEIGPVYPAGDAEARLVWEQDQTSSTAI